MERKKRVNPCRLEKESFRRRKATLFNKANLLSQHGADVYVVLRRYNRFYTYSSSSSRWPPSLKEIVGLLVQISSLKEILIERQKQSSGSHIGPAYFDKSINIDKDRRIGFTSANLEQTPINGASHNSAETEPKPPVDVYTATEFNDDTIEAEQKSWEHPPLRVPDLLFHQDRYHASRSTRNSRTFRIPMPPLLSTSPLPALDDTSARMIG